MALRKAKKRCIFLDDENRCTVYESRPMTCRTFPLQIHLDEDEKIEKIELNRIIKKKYPIGKKGKPWKEAEKQARKEDREDETYFDKVDRWNEGEYSGGKSEFLKFLGLSK